MESRFNKPSFYLLSSAIDGNENAIQKLLYLFILFLVKSSLFLLSAGKIKEKVKYD